VDIPRVTDDALAQSTRAAIFARLLDEAGADLTTAQLAEALDLHPNGIRVHLERLLEAGLVIRDRQRHGRGRPRDVWRVNPDAKPGGEQPTAYRELARWLAAAVGSGRQGVDRAVETGMTIGRDTELPPEGTPADQLRRLFTAMGFQPTDQGDDPANPTFVLGNCPFREAVHSHAGVVCGLHRGLTEGILERFAPGASLADFVINDPEHAGCQVVIRGLPADDGSGKPPSK